MGNCTGFCVSNNNVPSDDSGNNNYVTKNQRRSNITSEKVQNALIEKEEMFREDGGLIWNVDAGPEGKNHGESRNAVRKVNGLSYSGLPGVTLDGQEDGRI